MGHSFLFARWRWAEDLGAGAILAACFFGSPAQAQQFAAPSCGNSLADSTCYTAPTPNNCSLPDARISERGACPAGYVGMMDKQGTRDSCTGAATFAPGGDESGCTNCGSPLSQLEAVNMQRAILEVSESANQAYVSKVCSGFSCLDGASVNDLVTGQPIGRIFRDHVWVAQDGFSSGYLPTTNRVKYFGQKVSRGQGAHKLLGGWKEWMLPQLFAASCGVAGAILRHKDGAALELLGFVCGKFRGSLAADKGCVGAIHRGRKL